MAIRTGPGDVQDSSQALLRFLSELEDILDDVAQDPDGLVPNALREDLQRAWPRVQPLFGSARAVVEAMQGTLALEVAGLTDDQLAFKLGVSNRAQEQYRASRAPRPLAWFLRRANNILKSLPIPSAIKEPIEEFKTAVEMGAEEAAEDTGSRRPPTGDFKL